MGKQNQDTLYQLPANLPQSTGEKLSLEELSKFIALINTYIDQSDHANFLERMHEHVGEIATYALKDAALEGLNVIYHKLKSPNTGESEKKIIAIKLHERAEACSPGFHNGVNAIIDGFYTAKDLDDLLYRIRQDIVSRVATQLTDEVHTNNRCFVVAENKGYGVHALNKQDIYRGELPDAEIQSALENAFKKELTLFPMLQGFEDQLKGQLGNMGYEGLKENAYPVDEYHKIETALKQLFKHHPAVTELEAAQDALDQQESAKKRRTNDTISSLINFGLSERNIRVFLNPQNIPLMLKNQLQAALNQRSDSEKTAMEKIKLHYTKGMASFDKNVRTRLIAANEAFRAVFFIENGKGMTDINWPNVRQIFWNDIKAHRYFTFEEGEEAQLDMLMNPLNSYSSSIDWPKIIQSCTDFIQAIRYLFPDKKPALFDAVKNKRLNIIRSAKDFHYVIKHLLPEQHTEFWDNVKEQLPDIIKSTKDFRYVMKLLTPKGCTELWEIMKSQLPNLIIFTKDFCYIAESLSPEQRTELWEAVKNQLPNIIRSAKGFHYVMKLQTPKGRTILWEIVKEQLPNIIRSVEDFRYVMEYLLPEQRTELWATVNDQLPNIIRSAKDFHYVMKLKTPAGRTILWETMKNHPPSIIRSAEDFRYIMEYLLPEQRTELWATVNDQLPKIIRSAEDFRYVMEYLLPEQRTELWATVNDQLPRYLRYAWNFHNAMSGSSAQERSELWDAIKYQLPSIIKSAEDFRYVIKYLSAKQRSVLLVDLKDQLRNIIQSASATDAQKIIKYLSREPYLVLLVAIKDSLPQAKDNVRVLFFEYIKNYLPEIIRSGADFSHTLWKLTPEQRTFAFAVTQEKLPKIIKSSIDFGYALTYLTPEQQHVVYEQMKYDLPGMIHSGEDINYALIHLTPEQRLDIFNRMEHLPKILTSAKDFGLAISCLSPNETVAPAFTQQLSKIKNDTAWIQEMISACKNTHSSIIKNMFETACSEQNINTAKLLGKTIAHSLLEDMHVDTKLAELKLPKDIIQQTLEACIENTVEIIGSDMLPLSDVNEPKIRLILLESLKTIANNKDSELGSKLQRRQHPKLDKLLGNIIPAMTITPKIFSKFKKQFNGLVNENKARDQSTRETITQDSNKPSKF